MLSIQYYIMIRARLWPVGGVLRNIAANNQVKRKKATRPIAHLLPPDIQATPAASMYAATRIAFFTVRSNTALPATISLSDI